MRTPADPPVVADDSLPTLAPRWIAVLLAVLVLATFARAVQCDFVLWDDYETLAANTRMTPPTWAGAAHYWFHPHMDLYVPVLYTIWSGIAAMAVVRAGSDVMLDPQYFHAANVIAHAATALVVFALLRRLLRHAVRPDRSAPAVVDLAAAVGALVFAIHPVQVEPVTWASGMKDVLCGFFVLVAVWQYVRSAEAPRDAAWRPYALGTLAVVLGMLTKPTAMMTPLLALVVHVLVLRRDIRSAARPLGAWLLLAVACAVWTKLAQPASHVAGAPLWLRPVVALDALAFYLWKLAWPAQLTVDYGRTPAVIVREGWAWWTWLVPATMAAALWWWRRRHDARPLAAAAALFVLGMLPVLGFVRFDFQAFSTVSDRYLYLPMFGAALAAAWWAARAGARWGPRAAGAIALVVVVALGPMSARQVGVWSDSETLFSHAVAVNPRSYVGHCNLATYADMLATLEEYQADVASATGQPPAVAAAHRAAATAHYQSMVDRADRALEIRPGYAIALELKGTGLLNGNQPAKAAEVLRQVTSQWDELSPGHRNRRAHCFYLLGQALLRTGRPIEAQDAFQRLLKIHPDHPSARQGLADASAAVDEARHGQAQATIEPAPVAP